MHCIGLSATVQITATPKFWRASNDEKMTRRPKHTVGKPQTLIPTASSYYAGLPEHHSEEVERFMTFEIRTQSCIQNSESIVNYHIRK